jgi:hypothetical protein
MTHKAITFEFVVPTVLAAVLGIVLSIGAVYLTNRYLGPVEQSEANRWRRGSATDRAKIHPCSAGTRGAVDAGCAQP